MSASRGTWNSSFGFILASAGAAVGLGNIQRFPYVVASHGGAAFVLLYLACVLFLALPLILVEFSLGRHTVKNPICAVDEIKPKSFWIVGGILGVLTAFMILSYYSVVGGWTIGFFMGSLFGETPNLDQFTHSPTSVFGYLALFLSLCAFIVSKGVKRGIERLSKVLMPLLLCILILLVIRSLTLPNSAEGLRFYLSPDFSKLDVSSFSFALSQAFFSLCIGEGVLLTYGSYAKKSSDLFSSACYIALFDTIVALLAGLIIFPALSSVGMSSDAGMALTFHVLPQVFEAMPFGMVFAIAFFALLGFAALTTGVALLEIPVMYLIDKYKMGRRKAVVLVSLLAFVIAIPSATSRGISFLTTSFSIPNLGIHGVYEFMDFLFGGVTMALGGGILAFFTAWIWGANHAADELEKGSKGFRFMRPLWIGAIRYVAPPLIALILLSLFLTFS